VECSFPDDPTTALLKLRQEETLQQLLRRMESEGVLEREVWAV